MTLLFRTVRICRLRFGFFAQTEKNRQSRRARRLKKCFLCHRRCDAGTIDKQEPVAKLQQLRCIVAGKKNSRAVLRCAPDILPQSGGIGCPQAFGRMIQQNRAGVADQRLRKSDAAAFIGSESGKHDITQIVQFQFLQNRMNFPGSLGPALYAVKVSVTSFGQR